MTSQVTVGGNSVFTPLVTSVIDVAISNVACLDIPVLSINIKIIIYLNICQ